MNAKGLFLFIAIVGAIVWFSMKDDVKPARKPDNLMATQQKQMEKAQNLGKNMQESLDQRMQDTDH